MGGGDGGERSSGFTVGSNIGEGSDFYFLAKIHKEPNTDGCYTVHGPILRCVFLDGWMNTKSMISSFLMLWQGMLNKP